MSILTKEEDVELVFVVLTVRLGGNMDKSVKLLGVETYGVAGVLAKGVSFGAVGCVSVGVIVKLGRIDFTQEILGVPVFGVIIILVKTDLISEVGFDELGGFVGAVADNGV